MPAPAQIDIVSFGYLHGAPPDAHLILDLRHHFRDPHISPGLRHQTAHDQPVRKTVMATPGIHTVVLGAAVTIGGYLAGPSTGPVTVAFGCAGGRHRAATAAMALDAVMRGDTAVAASLGVDDIAAVYAQPGADVTLTHRDLGKPVVDR